MTYFSLHPPLFLFLFLLLLPHTTSLQFPQTTRQTEDGDSHGGPGFTILPLLSETPATAIILHGLGATGQEWAMFSLAMSVFSLNYVKFIIPTANDAPVSYLAGQVMPSWFDIERIQGTESTVNGADLRKSVRRVEGIVNGEIAAGVQQKRIFLVGFSQGGGLALTAFLRSSKTLGGCVGVATWLPRHGDYSKFGGKVVVTDEIKGRDVKMIHGTEDIAVDFPYGRLSARRIRQIGVATNFTEIEGAGHIIINAEVVAMIEDYIAERAPGTRQFLKSMVADLTDAFSGDSQGFMII